MPVRKPSSLKRYETTKPFSENEAWMLFRLAAFGEAIGWTLLITGILLKRFVLHGNDIAVLISGQIHGTLFIIYIAACVILYPSLRWPRWSVLIAGLASIPPYGSLLFEQVAAHHRMKKEFRMRRRLAIYTVLSQPAD